MGLLKNFLIKLYRKNRHSLVNEFTTPLKPKPNNPPKSQNWGNLGVYKDGNTGEFIVDTKKNIDKLIRDLEN